MQTGMAITVKYFAPAKGDTGLYDLEGVNDFRNELEADYVTFILGRPGGLGGLYQLSVQVVSTFALSHIVRLLLDGVAFDLIKSGAKAFVLRPFLDAYRKLRERNRPPHACIDELRLVFQDCVVTIDCMGHNSIASSLEEILRTLASNYEHLLLSSGESPFEIHVPVFEDPAEDRPSRFRVLLKFDETIQSIGTSDYFRFWGLWYDFSRRHRVYDVSGHSLIDEGFLSIKEYWDILEERRKGSGAEGTSVQG